MSLGGLSRLFSLDEHSIHRGSQTGAIGAPIAGLRRGIVGDCRREPAQLSPASVGDTVGCPVAAGASVVRRRARSADLRGYVVVSVDLPRRSPSVVEHSHSQSKGVRSPSSGDEAEKK